MNSFNKGFELFSFEFSLPRASCIACPNCGYQIYSTILHKVSISKTFVLFCCGSFVYWNYLKEDPYSLISLLSSAKDLIQNGITSLFWSSSSSSSAAETASASTSPLLDGTFTIDQSNTTNVLNQYYQCSSNSVRNQVIFNNQNNNNNEEQESLSPQNSNDFLSLNLSPLNSIGTGTVAKLDGMLNEVQEIKMYVNDSCNEIGWFTGSSGQLRKNQQSAEFFNTLHRRVSDGEITTSLPSLEWDLSDINFENTTDNDSFDGHSNLDFYDEQNNRLEQQQQQQNSAIHDHHDHDDYTIDGETLSRIIFNKNFEFKDEKFFRMKKQYVNLKQRLKFMSKSQQAQQQQQHRNNFLRHHHHHHHHNHNNNNLNSYNYRSQRDSAFFDEDM
ncbi:uncharacterized protein LOC124500584 [Dermatophagoides farinae]|uniref:uncharacterized protein LOC124500584 n=1 Tax=Dermatophagoides farinae TaxID=6954 RepID=UPI003F5F8727